MSGTVKFVAPILLAFLWAVMVARYGAGGLLLGLPLLYVALDEDRWR